MDDPADSATIFRWRGEIIRLFDEDIAGINEVKIKNREDDGMGISGRGRKYLELRMERPKSCERLKKAPMSRAKWWEMLLSKLREEKECKRENEEE